MAELVARERLPCRRARRRAPAQGWSASSAARSRDRRRLVAAARRCRRPASPDGTSPNAVRAEYAPADVRVGREHPVAGGRGVASSGEPGSVTTTMRPAGRCPAAAKAASKARRWLSVSTVEPDLLDTTTHGAGLERSAEGARAPGRGRCCRAPTSGRRVPRDDLGRQRRPAHAARGPRGRRPGRAARRAGRSISATSGRETSSRRRPSPAASTASVLGVGAPQRGVVRGQPARDHGRPTRAGGSVGAPRARLRRDRTRRATTAAAPRRRPPGRRARVRLAVSPASSARSAAMTLARSPSSSRTSRRPRVERRRTR